MSQFRFDFDAMERQRKVLPGAKSIVVDAVRTPAAAKADVWLQPRPATDLALALGILNVIVNESLYDQDFVRQWTSGFEKLAEHIQSYSPAKVSRITWVPEEKIIAAARMYAACSPACLYNGNASDDTYNSTQFARTIAILQAVCGNLDIPGGTIAPVTHPFDFEGTATDVLCKMLPRTQVAKKLGASAGHFPVDDLWEPIVNKPAELQFQYLISTLLEGGPYPVKAGFVLGCNPVMTWCDSRRVHEALQQLEFLVVTDLFMTPTATLADVVLPAASYLETDGVLVKRSGKGDAYVQAQRKVVQIGQCRSDLDIINALAGKLGLGEYFWESERSYFDDYLKPIGITFSELCRQNMVVASGFKYRKHLEQGFATPSGKVELYSSLCEKWGYTPLPDYREPKETPVSAPEMMDSFPLILTSTHEPDFEHSQDRHLKIKRDRAPEPMMLIHPDTAADLGICDGDMVLIENQRGSIRQKAMLSTDIDPRVVRVAYGWWFPEKGAESGFGWDDANINILTDDSPPYSPEIGSPSMRGFLCKVSKLD
jgi:anaerobic selenocysteine-containing dehydrogenase